MVDELVELFQSAFQSAEKKIVRSTKEYAKQLEKEIMHPKLGLAT